MFIVKDFPLRIITLSSSHFVLIINDLIFGIGLHSIVFSSLMLVLSFTFVPYIVYVFSSDLIKNKTLIYVPILLALFQYFNVSIFTGLIFVFGVMLIRLLTSKQNVLNIEYEISDSTFTLFYRSTTFFTKFILLFLPLLNFCYLYFYFDINPLFDLNGKI
jgi:hypothetical protein